MAEPSFLDPSPFQNFPHFNPSDLDFPFHDGFDSQIPNLDDIDLDFSIDDLDLDLDFNGIGSSPNSNSNSNSNLTTDSDSNSNSNPGSPGNSSVGIKRKIDDGENTIGNPNPKPNHEIMRPDEEEEKRKARMMRNRESAQLSRQRKKQYVKELEQKVKVLNSMIADLNGKVTFYMAENARLHQQLNGNVGNDNDNGTHCAVYPLPHHYPWNPYAMRPSGFPYIPIPRLKTLHTSQKSGDKKRESKKKKVASASLFGLLVVLMLFAGVMNFGFGGSRNKDNGRVLSVKGRSLNNTDEFGMFCGKMGSDDWGSNRMYQKVRGARHNSSETLPALLYVPRNGKHVEINGNLILHSVLACERAMEQAKFKGKESRSSRKEDTGLAIQGHISSPLAISKGTMDVGKHCMACENSVEQPRALLSDSHDACRDNIKSTLADRTLQQWFLEGLAGPILSSGTCTEIFQFEVNPSGIIPVTSAVNASDKFPTGKIKSRRILYQPIPLNGTTLNNTQNFDNGKIFNGNKSKPSMVVSVLADPRDAGDGDGDKMIAPKSLSRIFVVVLLDGVKYVTYSCMLPWKSYAPHLVN